MLDIDFYLEKHLNASNFEKFKKFFKKFQAKSISSMRYQLENKDLSWIDKDETRDDLKSLCSNLAISLKTDEVEFSTILQHILDQDWRIDEHFPEFELKVSQSGGTDKGICPSCGKKRLFVPVQGTARIIKCGRENNCGYKSSIFNYLTKQHNYSSYEALKELAKYANVDIEAYKASFEKHLSGTIETYQAPVKSKDRIIEAKEPQLKYMELDKNKEFVHVDFALIPKIYKKLHSKRKAAIETNDETVDLHELDRQIFVTIVSFIYDFSLQTKQWGKNKYYKGRGISAKDNPLLLSKVKMIASEVGYLHNCDIKNLINELTTIFEIDDLVRFGVLTDAKAKYPYSFIHSSAEGFCIIPNFDLYTNMVTGLKLRNTKLHDWQKPNMKEPELSFGRIAKPLPYALKREHLLDVSMKFRFTEGSVDMFSLPSKDGYCDIAIPGVNGLNESIFGLFKDREIELWFDQDHAGLKTAYGYYEFKFSDGTRKEVVDKNINLVKLEAEFKVKGKRYKGLKEKLTKVGAKVIVKSWNINLGSDVNEVLENKNLEKLLEVING